MLTSSDLIQALRPAFIVYALAMASTGAALPFASDDARQAAVRAPAALRLLERRPVLLADVRSARPVASAPRVAESLRIGVRAFATSCAGAAADSAASKAVEACGAVVAGALAGLP